MLRAIKQCKFCINKKLFEIIFEKRNKQSFPVGIKSEREKRTSRSPSIFDREGGEPSGAIFFQRRGNYHPVSV